MQSYKYGLQWLYSRNVSSSINARFYTYCAHFTGIDMEGWEAYALHGAGEALSGVKDTCFVFCEVWDGRDRKRRYLALRDTDESGPPCNDVLSPMTEHPNFEQN